jgi:hypothetical protein
MAETRKLAVTLAADCLHRGRKRSRLMSRRDLVRTMAGVAVTAATTAPPQRMPSSASASGAIETALVPCMARTWDPSSTRW